MWLGITFSSPLALLLLPAVLGWAAWLWLRGQDNLSTSRRRLALGLRLIIMGALILVLAGATWQQTTTRQATIFVADLSASVAALRDAEVSFITRALRARGHDDVAAVVDAGGDAQVEQPVGALSAFSGFQSIVIRGATNLEEGLNLAGALFPSAYRKRVVLLTDGRENAGDAVAATRLLHDEGVRLDVAPLVPPAGVEALVSGVSAPADVNRGARVPLTVALRSTVAQPASFDVLDGTRPLLHRTLVLPAGQTQFTLSLPALPPGFHRLHVALYPSQDTVAENNVGDALTRVRGPARVLVAEGLPGEGAVVAAALRAKGMTVQQIEATQIDPSTAYLGKYDAVALVDVPAIELDPALLDPAQSPLQSYVDGGHGLVVIGGPNSYGVGGYSGTALDNLLPVSMKLPQRRDTPSVAVALVIEDLETQTNVNVSKVAGEGVIKLLTPADRVAVNDARGTDDPGGSGWAVPLQYVTNKDAINHAIDAMNPIDPMSYQPALTAALKTLQRSGARIKHIILLGDGDAEDAYYPLVSRIRRAGITISTVATGGGPGGFGGDYATMQNIARWGGGRYYPADNVNNIPQIFLKETKQIARTGIVEERFVPEIASDSPILDGLPGAPLAGYVATTPKPAGLVVLTHVTKHGLDPILAQWQYGLGRVVAWTSDAQGRWSADLISSGQGNRLWANMVSWVLPPASSRNLSFLPPAISGGQAHLTVIATGLPLETQLTATVAGPMGSTTTAALQPTAPGQYEADVPVARIGAYVVGIRAFVGGHLRATLSTGLVAPYSAEYASTGLNRPLLTTLTAVGGGAWLSDPSASFADNLPAVYAPRPLTAPLLLLALLLLPVDVAVRRLLIGPAEAREILAALFGRAALRPAAATPGGVAAPLTTVRARREQRRDRALSRNAPDATPPAPPLVARGAPPSRPARVPPPDVRHTADSAPSEPAAQITPGAGAAAPDDRATVAGRLLEARRKRRGE